MNCEVNKGDITVMLSIPDVLGALVLKGAACVADSRDRDRHAEPTRRFGCS